MSTQDFFLDTIVNEKKYEIKKLEKSELPDFFQYVDSHFESQYFPKARFLAYGASFQGLPLGFLYFQEHPHTLEYSLLSLYVSRSYRGCGIGSELLKECPLDSFWTMDPQGYDSFLTRNHFKATGDSSILFWGDSRDEKVFPYIPKVLRTIPKPYELLHYHELTSEHFNQMEEYLKQDPKCVKQYLPRYYEAPVETSNSFFVCKNSQLIGWILNHRVSSDHIHYSAIYFAPEFRRSRLVGRLITKSYYTQIRQVMEVPKRSGKVTGEYTGDTTYIKKLRYFFPHSTKRVKYQKIIESNT